MNSRGKSQPRRQAPSEATTLEQMIRETCPAPPDRSKKRLHPADPAPAAVASEADVLERMIRDTVIIPDRSKEGPAKIIPTRAAKPSRKAKRGSAS